MVATTTTDPTPELAAKFPAAFPAEVVDPDLPITGQRAAESPEPVDPAREVASRGARQDATDATTEPAAARPVRLEQLVEAEPVVRRICRSDLGYWDGDDAAQEALTHVWKASQRPDFEDRGTLVPFGVACARGQVKTGYRGRDRRPEPVGDQAEWGRGFADTETSGPDQAAERAEAAAEARRRVEALLDELTPRQRQAVTECALRERDTDEVAAELGTCPSSVRSSQVRAMARMRELCGTRSPNPLSHGRTAAEEYERRRQDWERVRADCEQTEGREIPRRASRHRAVHVAAGRLPAQTGPAGRPSGVASAASTATEAGRADPVARATAAAARARRSVEPGLAAETTSDQAARRAQLAAWHRDDHSDHDGDHGHGGDGDGGRVRGDADGWADSSASRGAGAA